jgi:hypothetical protein
VVAWVDAAQQWGAERCVGGMLPCTVRLACCMAAIAPEPHLVTSACFGCSAHHLADASLPALARRYFASRNSLPRQYWTSLERNGSFSLYAFPDLSYLSQIASNEPYAHW